MTPELINRLAAHEVTRQFVRFAAVGAVATAVHYSILIGLKEGLGVAPVVATTLGYSAGALVSYTLNRRFTFDVKPEFATGLVKFLIVVFIGALINGAIVAGLIRVGLYYLLAQVIATALVLIWNFVASRLVVFR
ncbi:MAG TPA: GtrA family protein [Caulobacterales bacterium]|nr:GtrA family protein [Caulobacterales bacterium]